MDWWMLISRVAVVVFVTITLEILLARRNRKRIARLEALRGDWDREAHWVGVVVRGHDGGPPGTVRCEGWSGFYAGEDR